MLTFLQAQNNGANSLWNESTKTEQTFSSYKLIVSGICPNMESWWPLVGTSNSRVKTVVKHVMIKHQNVQRNDLALHIRLHLDELHCRGAVGIIPRMRILFLQ